MKVDRELRRDRPATAPSTEHSQALAQSFEAALRRLRKRDCESDFPAGDIRTDLPKPFGPEARAAAVQPPPPRPPARHPPDCPAFRFRWLGVAATCCLEVVHARTGTRFVLSRDSDAWLLALECDSTCEPAELAGARAELSEAFAARGLGPIDVILD